MRLVDSVLEAEARERLAIYSSLTPDEKLHLQRLLEAEENNPWAQYEQEPLQFITEALGETVWSKQREIIDSVMVNQRTVVAACHAPGKSWLAARMVSWWVASHAPGTSLAITLAPTHRQVRN